MLSEPAIMISIGADDGGPPLTFFVPLTLVRFLDRVLYTDTQSPPPFAWVVERMTCRTYLEAMRIGALRGPDPDFWNAAESDPTAWRDQLAAQLVVFAPWAIRAVEVFRRCQSSFLPGPADDVAE